MFIELCAGSLQRVSLSECAFSSDMVKALAKSSESLMGIIIADVNNYGVTDQCLAALLKKCCNLKWLMVDDSDHFDTGCWRAIGSCSNLEVLWIDTPKEVFGRDGVVRGDHDVIRQVIAGLSSKSLKLCMINPDTKAKSRYGMGVKDRLNGRAVRM